MVNNAGLNLVTIVGTRPELIKLSRVIPKLDVYFNHILVHTGQNFDYELNEVFYKDLSIRKPDYFLDINGGNVADSVAMIIKESYELLNRIKPDAVLVYGDTNSCLSVFSAKRLKIPVFHMEAGNRCFDQNVPEEINRKIVDHLSDINMVISENAQKNLLREGIAADKVIKIGSSMKEVLESVEGQIRTSNILKKLNVEKNEYFLVSLHREENVDSKERLLQAVEGINNLKLQFNKKVLFSVHPRTLKRLKEFGLLESLHSSVELMKPFGFIDYIVLQSNSFCVVSDSGTISEESSLLKFPAVTIRFTHERQEAMEQGVVIMVSDIKKNLSQAVSAAINLISESTVTDYSFGSVSNKVVKIIISYVDYVKRYNWHVV